MIFKGLPPDKRYGKPSMYHILHCIKCTLHIKKIFARMRVEPKLDVSYVTCTCSCIKCTCAALKNLLKLG